MQSQITGELRRALASQQLRALDLQATLDREREARAAFESEISSKMSQMDVLLKAKRVQTIEAESYQVKLKEEISRLEEENDELRKLRGNLADAEAIAD